MVENKDEVFTWFKQLSGAKRVEVIYGLLNLCIPLEWRYFATILENLGRRDYMMLKNDENVANSVKDLQEVCNQSWLETELPSLPVAVVRPSASGPTSPVVLLGDVPGANVTHSNNSSKRGAPTSTSSATSPSSGNSPYESRTTSPAPLSTTSAPPPLSTHNQQQHHVQSNARSKVVIYLCLLHSTNRSCATVLFKAFKKQLSLENVRKHMENVSLMQSAARGNARLREGTPVASGDQGRLIESRALNSIVVDQQFMAEIILLFTLAIHHSAFTFEQQTQLARLLSRIKHYMDGLVSAASLTPLLQTATSHNHPHHLPTFPPTTSRPANVSIAQLQQHVGALSPSIRVTTKLEALSVNTGNGSGHHGEFNGTGKQMNTARPTPSPTPPLDNCSECSFDSGPQGGSNKNGPKNSNSSCTGTTIPPRIIQTTQRNSSLTTTPVIPSVISNSVTPVLQQSSILVNGSGGDTKTPLIKPALMSTNPSKIGVNCSDLEVIGHCPSCACSLSGTTASNSLATTPSSTPPPLTSAMLPHQSQQLPTQSADGTNYPLWYMFPPPANNSISPSAEWMNQYYQHWTFAFGQGSNMFWPPSVQFPVSTVSNNNLGSHSAYTYSTVTETFQQSDHRPKHPAPPSCYNCGELGHRGSDCIKETLDDVTKENNFNLNFDSPIVPATSESESYQLPLTNGAIVSVVTQPSIIGGGPASTMPRPRTEPQRNPRPTRMPYQAGQAHQRSHVHSSRQPSGSHYRENFNRDHISQQMSAQQVSSLQRRRQNEPPNS